MAITSAQALIIAIWVALVESRIFGRASVTLRFSPLMTGLIVGLVLNDVKNAMFVTAAIQLVYMGVVAPGGTLPAEPAVAAAVAVTSCLLGDLSPAEGVAIAVPVGLLGSYLYQFRFFLNTMLCSKKIDEAAVKKDDKALGFWIMFVPLIISLVVFVPMMYIALKMGAPVISSFVNSVSSGKLFHILTVVGGGLAALGIAVIMHVIGKREFLLFFFLAYFMSITLKPLGVTTTTYAIFAVIAAGLYIMFTKGAEDNG